MWSSLLVVLSISAFAQSAAIHKRANAGDAWFLERFSSLVTFGDSYTDENRLNYFFANKGAAPPPGTLLPETFNAPSGGRTWPRYVIQYTGRQQGTMFVPHLQLYDYAVSGAVCSNLLTPRFVPAINGNFPSVREYEIPAFLADKNSTRNGTNTPYFHPPLTKSNTVYAMWIGTNDLGDGALLTDSQVPGVTLTDYTDCIFKAIDSLYAAGGRYFVMHNVIPLELVALYANDTFGGTGPNRFWPDKPANHTAIAIKMKEYSTTVNNVMKYQIPYEAGLSNRYPGANFAYFDVHSLFLDIYNDPKKYLNGTAPANVTGFENHCDLKGANCVRPQSPDSFLWFDELHPSEQADRIVARNFVEVLQGTSKYASYY